MRLLCLGDIAIGDGNMPAWPPLLPPETVADGESRLLFNWELPIGDRLNPTPRSSGPRLLAHPQSVDVIRRWAPGFAALATNHVMDGGEEGLADTMAALNKSGFVTTGAGRTEEEIRRPLFWETREGRLAIINWVFPETHPEWLAVPGPNCWPGEKEAKRIIHELRAQADWVLVLAHWSDELFAYPRPQDRAMAHQLAHMGADLIVGHHAHVVRGMERIDGCPVFYGLGNLYFSDFSDGGGVGRIKSAPRNREGLGLLISFRRGQSPQHKLRAYWQVRDQVIGDPLHRATMRARWVSRPLARMDLETYAAWYARRRAWFDRWGARWHFGLRRRGLLGSLRYLTRHEHASIPQESDS